VRGFGLGELLVVRLRLRGKRARRDWVSVSAEMQSEEGRCVMSAAVPYC
jgi:hypothetical protein